MKSKNGRIRGFPDLMLAAILIAISVNLASAQIMGVPLPTPPQVTITQGGPPNFADTYITPYVATEAQTITSWKAQFEGGNLVPSGSCIGGPGIPSGIQLKVLRQVSANMIQVISAGAVHDPRPILQQRFDSYPYFVSEESVIEFTDSGLSVQPGDVIGLTIKADPQVCGYFYPLVNVVGTRLVLRDVPEGGTIDLTDLFTGTLSAAPALQVNTDITPPTITVPADITAEANEPNGAAVSYIATANDNIDGPITPTCSPASGSTFAIGATTVSCTATDAAGNIGSKSFTVTVQDTTPPAITVPSDITAEATSSLGVSVTFTASATDIVDGIVATSCSPASGSTFPIGATAVKCKATDTSGNTASASFTVTVTNPFDFSLAASPQSQTVRPGGNAIFTVDATLLSGITQNVGLSVTVVNSTNAPEPSIASSISPSSVMPTSSATVFVGTNSDTPAGTYNVIVTGTYGAIQKTASVSVTVSGQSLPNNPIAFSDYTVRLVTGTPLTHEIKVPASGDFVVVLTTGSIYSVIDNDATDGLAKIQVIDNKYHKIYGRITGGNTNANMNVLSPFISGFLTPQPLTLPKDSPPETIDITSLNPYILQIPAIASNVDSTKSWVSSYYPLIGLPYSFTNSGAQETQLIFISQ